MKPIRPGFANQIGKRSYLIIPILVPNHFRLKNSPFRNDSIRVPVNRCTNCKRV
ncbi:hypothetical protein Hanom_Chr17g01550691 [Helianthus anomalus]